MKSHLTPTPSINIVTIFTNMTLVLLSQNRTPLHPVTSLMDDPCDFGINFKTVQFCNSNYKE